MGISCWAYWSKTESPSDVVKSTKQKKETVSIQTGDINGIYQEYIQQWHYNRLTFTTGITFFYAMLTAVHLGSVAVSDPRRTRVAASLPNGCALLRDRPRKHPKAT